MWFLDGAHRPATRLLVLLVLATNAITMLDMLRGHIGYAALTGPFVFAEFASIAFVGAAALHPSMALAPERQRSDLGPIGRRRIVALTAALLVNPATLAIEAATGRQIDPTPYLIGGTLIGILVIARLGDALRQLGESLRERDSLMELLRRQALYDALTSLPNRNLFTDRLTAEYANRSAGRLLAVLLFDLDDFKAVNDTYGHDAGDALLAAVGQRLRTTIRDGDTAARLRRRRIRHRAAELCRSPGPDPGRRTRPGGPSASQSTSGAIASARAGHVGVAIASSGRSERRTNSSATPTSRCTSPRAVAKAVSWPSSRQCRRPR